MIEGDSNENETEKIPQEISQDVLNFALNSLKDKNYPGVVEAITGIGDEENDFYEKTLDLVTGIFNKNDVDSNKISVVINHIYRLFVQHSSNALALDSNYISYASQFAPGTYPPEHESDINNMMHEKVNKELLSRLTDLQLSNKISDIREQHKRLLSRGEKVSKELVSNLNLLLEEKASRQGTGISKKKINDNDQNSGEVLAVSSVAEKGIYNFWFIQPTLEEMSKTINIHVVCGSPMVDTLRKRYKKLYSLEVLQEVRQQDLLRGSPEVQYELKKEQKRQEDFVESYFDPKNISDQDICSYTIYNTFSTDQFPEVPRFRENANTMGTYFLKHGRLINRFDPDKKIHSLKVDGNIIGRCSVSFNRREVVSGRIINDSYEIIEYQNGKPVLYFCSTKGRSALDNETLKDIAISMRGLKMNLLVPVAAQLSDEKILDKYKLQNEQLDKSVSINTDEIKYDIDEEQGNHLETVNSKINRSNSDVAAETAAIEQNLPPVGEFNVPAPEHLVEQSNAEGSFVVDQQPEEVKTENFINAEADIKNIGPQTSKIKKQKILKTLNEVKINATEVAPDNSDSSLGAVAQEQLLSKEDASRSVNSEVQQVPAEYDEVDLPSSQLRIQLINGIKKRYSLSTLRYLLNQIADKEGKTSEDIKQEIINMLPEAAEVFNEKKINFGIIKERAQKIKDSLDVPENKEESGNNS